MSSQISDPKDGNRPEEAEKISPINFFCICGSRTCTPKIVSNGIMGPGGRNHIEYYVCDGCSIHLSNPQNYSQAQRKLKNTIDNNRPRSLPPHLQRF
jgi:hypothetical protein